MTSIIKTIKRMKKQKTIQQLLPEGVITSMAPDYEK